MNHGRSFTIASLLILVLYVIAYVVHAGISGTFALPPAVLAIVAPLTPVIDYVVAYLVHGLATGEWEPPLPLPPAGTQGRGPATPEMPPTPPHSV